MRRYFCTLITLKMTSLLDVRNEISLLEKRDFRNIWDLAVQLLEFFSFRGVFHIFIGTESLRTESESSAYGSYLILNYMLCKVLKIRTL